MTMPDADENGASVPEEYGQAMVMQPAINDIPEAVIVLTAVSTGHSCQVNHMILMMQQWMVAKLQGKGL